jgi:hypothetical protein
VAERAASRKGFSKRRLLVWQLGFVLVASGIATTIDGASPRSVGAGALFLTASFVLQDVAFTRALSAKRRPAVAVGLFVTKLAMVLGLATIGLRALAIEPLSFAIGATTLLLAILAETWYADRCSR